MNARAAIDRTARSGDLVIHSPLLSVRDLAGLGDLLASPALPAAKLRRGRRSVVLDVEDQPMFGFGASSDVVEVEGSDGRLVLRVFEPERASEGALFDLSADLSAASMSVERPAGRVSARCDAARSEGGRSCPGEAEWLYLARRNLVVGGSHADCVWAHPTTGGVIVIELPAQPQPSDARKLQLSLSAGMVDDAIRNTPGGAEVRTVALQSSETRGQVTVPNRAGWVHARFDIEPAAPLQLRVTTPRDGARHHCINARIEEVER